jgi:hypothetical protein
VRVEDTRKVSPVESGAFVFMSDPFESSRRKIAWAKKNLADLKRESHALFSQKNFHEAFTEPHPNKPDHVVHKIRPIKQIPEDWSDMAGTVIDNLRAALDHATYGLAVAFGCKTPLNAYFPFSRDASTFEPNLKGRCADVPKEIYPLLRSFEPYKGGSEALWALNEICVTNKHKILVTVGSAAFVAGMDLAGTGFWQMPCNPVWDRAKNEMELFTTGPQTVDFKGKFDFGFYIAFGEVGRLEGEPAIPILDTFVDMVETIVNEIDTESRRLGIVK